MFHYKYRDIKKKSVLHVYASICLTVLFLLFKSTQVCGQGNSAPAQMSNGRPVIAIGTLPFNPPFETSDTNRGIFLGFEVDIMNSLCDRLQVQCVFKAIPGYDLIFDALTNRTINLTVASIVIVAGSQSYVFSYPFLPSYVQFFAKNSSKIRTLDEIKGKKIGILNDPLLQAVMLQKFGNNPPFKVYPSVQVGIDGLSNGDVDVMVLEAMSVEYWLSNTNGVFKKVGQPVPFGLGYGAMALKENVDFINSLNQALYAIENDGTYAKIYNRYFTTTK